MEFTVTANFLNVAGNATKSSKRYFSQIEAENLQDLEVVFQNKVANEKMEYAVGYDGIERKVLEYKGLSFATRTDGTSIGNTINRIIQ